MSSTLASPSARWVKALVLKWVLVGVVAVPARRLPQAGERCCLQQLPVKLLVACSLMRAVHLEPPCSAQHNAQSTHNRPLLYNARWA